MAWIAPVAAAAISAGAGIYSANQSNQGSATGREATRRQIDLGTDQYLTQQAQQAPYLAAGYAGLSDLFGIQAGGSITGTGTNASGGGSGYGSGGNIAVPSVYQSGDNWKSPTYTGTQSFTRSGTGIDPTGGAGEFMNKLKDYGSNFTFNESDPVYTQKMATSTRALNQQLAARGMYNSRAGMNLLDESGRNIMSEEYEKQYSRGYQNLTDLFNMSRTLGATEYGKALDAVKIGAGQSASAGAIGNQAVGNISSGLTNMATVAGQQANTNAQLVSGLGAMPMNYLILQNLLGSSSQAPATGTNWTDINGATP